MQCEQYNKYTCFYFLEIDLNFPALTKPRETFRLSVTIYLGLPGWKLEACSTRVQTKCDVNCYSGALCSYLRHCRRCATFLEVLTKPYPIPHGSALLHSLVVWWHSFRCDSHLILVYVNGEINYTYLNCVENAAFKPIAHWNTIIIFSYILFSNSGFFFNCQSSIFMFKEYLRKVDVFLIRCLFWEVTKQQLILSWYSFKL